jgi:hypothetical protein
MPTSIRSSLLFWFLIGFSHFSLAELEAEPNNKEADAMTITSGLIIEASTDDSPATQSEEGGPDFFLIEVDNEDQPSGITIRIDGDDCTSCKAINFSLIDKSTSLVIVAENAEQSTTRSKQLIQQEYNITGDAYLKIMSSGKNQDYDLTVWVNDGLHYSAEVEPNDGKTVDTYNYLPNGREFQGNISDISDDDWIRFTPALSVASFQVTAEGCDQDGTPESQSCSSAQPSVAWSVFRDSVEVRTGNTASDTTNQTRAFEIPISPEHINKDHYIKFYSDHVFAELDREFWSNRTYSVTYYEVPQAEEEFETEPNNDSSKANTIVSGTTYEGNISQNTSVSSTGDLDYYLIDVVSESSYSGVTIRLEADDSNIAKAVHFELRDKNSDVLIASENAEQTVVNSSEQVIEAKYNIQGDAYLTVFSNQTGQSYKLTVFVDESSAHLAEYEPNNSFSDSSARPLLKHGKRVRGNLSADSDVDFFKIDNPAGKATFFITTEGCDIDGYGEGDPYLNSNTDECSSLKVSLLNSDDDTLNTVVSDPGTANQVKSLSANLPEGVSYLKVESDHEFSRLQNRTYQNRTYELVGFLPAAPRVTITSSAGVGGSISPAGKSTIELSGSKTFVATPDANYSVNAFTDTCNAQSSRVGNTYTISEVTKDCNVTVTFTPLITIIASSSDGGSISPEGEIKIASGVSQSFTASAASGFQFEYWTGSCPKTYSALLTSVEVNSSVNCTINAQFSLTPGDDIFVTITSIGYPVSFSVPGKNIVDSTGSTEVKIEQYSNLTLTFNHEPQWNLTQELAITGCGQSPVPGNINTLTLTSVTESCELKVNLRDKLKFDFLLSIEKAASLKYLSASGTVSGTKVGPLTDESIQIGTGESVTFTATIVETPYVIDKIISCGQTTTFTGGTQSHEFDIPNISQDCVIRIETSNPYPDSDGDGIDDSNDYDDDNDGVPDNEDSEPLNPQIPFTARHIVVYAKFNGGWDGDIATKGSNGNWDWEFGVENTSLVDVDPKLWALWAHNADGENTKRSGFSESQYTAGDGILQAGESYAQINRYNQGNWDSSSSSGGPIHSPASIEVTFTHPDTGDSFSKIAKFTSQGLDLDGDGVLDLEDVFPADPDETLDSDGDGIGNNRDNCVDVVNYGQVNTDSDETGDKCDNDDDNDGVLDASDLFPLDSSESADTDSDGVGDNSDVFPNDSSESTDTDSDGVGDNSDAFPNDSSESVDTDSDGVGDNSDVFPNDSSESVDTDSDGVGDNSDVFPNDSSESADTDSDGVGDNSDVFPLNSSESVDTDSDGVGDNSDVFPLDSSESVDTDSDGVGDNSDVFPNDSSESVDTDSDGVGDNSDAYPNDSSESVDTDSDGIGDNSDEFPNDSSESVDTDSDGTGNNADTDDDGDAVLDVNDAFPLDSTESVDTDSDGIGNNADLDDDNDGVSDTLDVFPLDGTEWVDTDVDGIGNNGDADDDNDGVADNADALPLDSTETVDTDSDGIGNNADTDDDGDGVDDLVDVYPLNSLYSQDSDLDGMPDAWETQYGLDLNDASDATSDQDNDGVLALDEFLAGTIPSGSIDLDGNGAYDALTDGLLLLRGMFGLTGDALTGGTVASNATYTAAVDIESRIATLGDLADVDGNGQIDALTDGLLTLRYLFGLEGDTLINGVVAADATRTSAADIEAHLASLMPAL